MLNLLTDVLDRLLVYPANMQKNLDRTHGLIFSQSVLLALTNRGMKREDAYRVVQGSAMEIWSAGGDFKSRLSENPEVMKVLTQEELDALFDLNKSLQHVDHIFERVGLG